MDTTDRGVDGFIAELSAQGIPAERRGDMVVFSVTAVSGCHAGEEIEAGLVAADLEGWPSVPPHWVHLPGTVELPGGSREASGHLDGWFRYSRPHPGRIDAERAPARAWVAHVRGLIGSSTR